MVIDFAGCYVVERVCKALFAELEPAELVTRGSARREKRRLIQDKERKEKEENGILPEVNEVIKKKQ